MKTKKQKPKRIVVNLPAKLKARLDTVQQRGFTLSGFVRAAVEKALTDFEKHRQ